MVLSLFENQAGLSRPLWRDISRYQGLWNPSVSRMNGVQGVAIRAGISWGYEDPRFKENWDKAEGMYRTSYHVLYPDQPILRQADNWFRIHPEIDIIPRVIDLEIQRDCTARTIAQQVWQMSNIVAKEDGVRPIIYSRYLLINNWLRDWSDVQLNIHYYWLAQYTWDRVREHPGPPTLPHHITEDRILLHQTADKKAGFSGEVESKSVDWDRWLIGNVAEMHEWIMDHWGIGAFPLTLEEKVGKLWQYHPELHSGLQ